MVDHASSEAAGVTSEKDTGLNYFLEGSDEVKRLEQQHPVIKASMGGRLILAPIDFGRKDMRILDSGTSDGKTTRFLQSFSWLVPLFSLAEPWAMAQNGPKSLRGSCYS